MNKKVLVFLGVVLIVTLIFNSGCKKSFNIVGSWTFTENWSAAETETSSGNPDFKFGITRNAAFTTTMTFTGTETSGTWSIPSGVTGTYTVNDRSVSLIITSSGNCGSYSGTAADDNNTVTGTATCPAFPGSFGTWTMVRL